MLFGVGVSFRIMYSIVSFLYVSYGGLITSVGEERANLSEHYRLLLIIWFLYGEVSSSSWCL